MSPYIKYKGILSDHHFIGYVNLWDGRTIIEDYKAECSQNFVKMMHLSNEIYDIKPIRWTNLHIWYMELRKV